MSHLLPMEARVAAEGGSDAPAASVPAAWGDEAKRYGYRVGTFGFLVSEKARSEVVRAPVLSAIPHGPRWLLGLMNLRGNLVPVADLKSLCGEPAGQRAPAMVLVLGTGEKAVAIPIDALPRALANLRSPTLVPPLPAAIAAHVGQAFDGEGGVWLAFEHEEFFRAMARESDAHA